MTDAYQELKAKGCHELGCHETDNLEFVDATTGPLYDPRFYCAKHMFEFRNRDAIRAHKARIRYAISDIKHDLVKASKKLEELQKILEQK